MKRRVFKDEGLQKQFEENAYCIVSLLSTDEIKALEKVYYNNRVNEQAAVEITIKNPDTELNRRIRDTMAAIVKPRIDAYLNNYRMLHAGFIAKIPGKPSIIKLHQDSTFVDEAQFSALNVWCPLTDVDESNGALWVIDQSDKFFPGLRGQPFKEFDFNDIGDEVIAQYGKMIPLKAGEAIIYDTALLHYSKPNSTSNIRIVSNIVVVPAEAQAFYFHFDNKEKTLQQYQISDDFLLSYFSQFLQSGKIDARLLRTVTTKGTQKVTVYEFEQQYFKYNTPLKTNLLQKMFSFFKKS